MKKIVFVIVLVLTIVSCTKEEVIPTYDFKQTAFLWQDMWGDGENYYPVFTYQIAVMGDQPIDEVKFQLTVVLNDSTKLIFTQSEMTNFSQSGFYNPNYQYPKYWIATIMDSKGICTQQYGFNQNDIFRFEYEAKVRIGKTWYDVPKEARKKDSLMDSFWI